MRNHKIQNVDQYQPEIIEKQFLFLAKMGMKQHTEKSTKEKKTKK